MNLYTYQALKQLPRTQAVALSCRITAGCARSTHSVDKAAATPAPNTTSGLQVNIQPTQATVAQRAVIYSASTRRRQRPGTFARNTFTVSAYKPLLCDFAGDLPLTAAALARWSRRTRREAAPALQSDAAAGVLQRQGASRASRHAHAQSSSSAASVGRWGRYRHAWWGAVWGACTCRCACRGRSRRRQGKVKANMTFGLGLDYRSLFGAKSRLLGTMTTDAGCTAGIHPPV